MTFSTTVERITETVIEIKIREGNRSIYKEQCSLNNKKQLSKIISFIKIKYGTDLTNLKNPEEDLKIGGGWFD